jgi:soluble lytic murein transglycosylase-like protein
LKVRSRWPLRLVGLAAFVLGGLAPLPLSSSLGRPVEGQILDPAIEEIARFLEWRAPEGIDPLLRRPIASAVVEEARAAELDPLYVLAVMEVESDFETDAVSNRNARGLMQVRSVVVKELERRNEAPDPANEPTAVVEVRHGVRYLASLEKKYRTRERALAAWNAGPGAVDKALAEEGEIPDRWLAFARKVLREHRRLRARLMPALAPTLATAGVRAAE